MLGVYGDLDIFENGEPRKDVGDLERARDPAAANLVSRQSGDLLAVKNDAPAIRLDLSGDEIEQRRLARAVRADDGDERALIHAQVCAVHRHKAVERFIDLLNHQHLGAAPTFALT